MTAAVELFGHDLPSPGVAVVILIFFVGVFLVSRGQDGRHEGQVERGRKYECERCGREYQIEHVELLASGDVRRWIDDRCPNCGWDKDWGAPKRPGGSGGRW